MARPLERRLPAARPAPGRDLVFPPGIRVSELRRLRDRLELKGQPAAALQAALEVARRDPGRESYLRLGVAQYVLGRYREALITLRGALRYREGAAYLIPDIHVHVAQIWYHLGRYKRAGEALRRAKAARPKPRANYNLCIVAGNIAMARDQNEEAVAEFQRAVAEARSASQRLSARMNEGFALIRCRRHAEALESLEQAIQVARRTGDRLRLALARGAKGWAYVEGGQFARALRASRNAAEECGRLGVPLRECEFLGRAAYVLWQMGRWEEARQIYPRVLSLAQVLGLQQTIVISHSFLAIAAARAGRIEEAESELRQARQRQRDRYDWIGRLHVLRASHAVAVLRQDWNEAFRAARHGERLAVQVQDLPRVAEFRKLRAAAEEQRGRHKAAVIARKRSVQLERLTRNRSMNRIHAERRLEKLAKTRLPLLLVGTPGMGSRAWARKLHEASPRKSGPLVVVACEQVAHEPTELYGWEAGAWSGAERGAEGYAQQAEGGTLLLEGLDRVPAARQKFYVALLDRKVRKVGGTEDHPADYRVIAVCEEPEKLVPELRTRLEAARVELPAVEELREELPSTIRVWLGAERRMTADGMLELIHREWPGGEAQLKAVVERIKVLAPTPVIGRRHVRQALAL